MESWDDDFGCEADLVLRASTSTVSSTSDETDAFDGLINRLGASHTSTTKTPITKIAPKMKNFKDFSDLTDFTTLQTVLSDGELDGFGDTSFGDGFAEDTNLTVKGNPLGGPSGGHTLTKIQPKLGNNSSTTKKSTQHETWSDDDFADGFDLPVDFTPLSVRKKQIYPSGLDVPEPQTPTKSRGQSPDKSQGRPVSHDSCSSVFSPASSMSYSETEAPEGDMSEGFDLPQWDKMDLTKVLEERKAAAEAEAAAESSKWQHKHTRVQDDFFEGIELNEDSFVNLTHATVNRCVQKNGKAVSKLKRQASANHAKRTLSSNNLAGQAMGGSRLNHMPSLPSLKQALRPSPSLQPRRVRPAQSMVNMHDRRKQDSVKIDSLDNLRKYNTVKTLNRPKQKLKFDGFELDGFADLDVADELRESPVPKALEEYRESTLRNPTFASRLKDKGTVKGRDATIKGRDARDGTVRARDRRGQGRDRPDVKRGLIQPMGKHMTPVIKDSGMSFNPNTMMWEGNDVDLKRFENTKPALLAFKSTKGAQVVGNMYFDPVKLCWKSMEVDFDELEGLDDLDDDKVTSPAADGQEFNISDDFASRLKHEQERWQRKTNGWFEIGSKFDRDYLWDIRRLIGSAKK